MCKISEYIYVKEKIAYFWNIDDTDIIICNYIFLACFFTVNYYSTTFTHWNNCKSILPSLMRLKFDFTEKGRHTCRRRAGCRGNFVVARHRLLLDGSGSFAIHTTGLAFEDRCFTGIFESTSRGVVELYSMLKLQRVN